MKYRTRITAKGQVTIPKDIRKRLGLLPNTEVEFAEDDGRIFMKKATSITLLDKITLLDNPFESVRGTSDTGMSTEDIMTLTRGGDYGDIPSPAEA